MCYVFLSRPLICSLTGRLKCYMHYNSFHGKKIQTNIVYMSALSINSLKSRYNFNSVVLNNEIIKHYLVSKSVKYYLCFQMRFMSRKCKQYDIDNLLRSIAWRLYPLCNPKNTSFSSNHPYTPFYLVSKIFEILVSWLISSSIQIYRLVNTCLTSTTSYEWYRDWKLK